MRRLTRLRTTEFPTRLLTVTPSRERSCFSSQLRSWEPAAITTVKAPAVRRFPDFSVFLKSRECRIRSARRKRPVFAITVLLRGNASCEALAALGPAALEYRAARSGLHSRTESMRALAADAARLIGSLHRRPSIFVVRCFVVLGGSGNSASTYFSGILRPIDAVVLPRLLKARCRPLCWNRNLVIIGSPISLLLAHQLEILRGERVATTRTGRQSSC